MNQDKNMMNLKDIMWPISQSCFHILFLVIEVKFIHHYSYAMFVMKSINICNG